MSKNNEEIRAAAKAAGVKLWQIADAAGLSDSTFSRKLRRELPTAEKVKILCIVAELASDKKRQILRDATELLNDIRLDD